MFKQWKASVVDTVCGVLRLAHTYKNLEKYLPYITIKGNYQ